MWGHDADWSQSLKDVSAPEVSKQEQVFPMMGYTGAQDTDEALKKPT